MVDPRSGLYDDFPHVAPGNIESFTGRVFDNVKTVKEEELISGKFRFRKGDIIYGKINPQLGKYAFAQYDGLTSADAYVLNAYNGVDQKYLFTVLQTKDFYDYSVSVSRRSGMPKINRNELNAYSFTAPNEEEQSKIGEFFLSIDYLITLHQREYFSFDFGGGSAKNVQKTLSWEQRKLSEISEKVSKKNQDMVVDEVFTNSAEFGIISQRDYFDKDIANSENIDGYYIVEPNDFVYNPRISTLAPFCPVRRNKLDKSGAMSPLYYVFRTHDVDCGYLEYFFKTNRWHSFMHLNGNSGARSDRFAIRDEVFRDMPISMPQDIVEQKKVGDFFSTLELAITLHQHKPIKKDMTF